MSKRTKSRKARAAARFKVGQRVRVRHGIRDEDYPDMPLGGWAGTISEVYRSGMYCVRWSRETLAAIHPIYKKRCAIDGMEVNEYWLCEDDLEPDPGGPLDIEQSTRIIACPLSAENQADRVRMVFGLTSDEFLPNVDNDSLETYYDYLEEHLSLPTEARCISFDDSLFTASMRNVALIGLDRRIAWDAAHGIMCEIRTSEGNQVVPLSHLQLRRSDANRRLLDDFAKWFQGELWAGRDDEWSDDGGGDADEEPGNEADDEELALGNATLGDVAVMVLGFLFCAAAYCAVAGTAIATMPWAKWAASVGGGVGIALTLLVDWQSRTSAVPIRNPSARRLAENIIGGLGGAVVGSFFGILAAAFVGAALGALAGSVLRKALRFKKLPLFQFFPGIVLCTAAGGAATQGFYLSPPLARLGLWHGTLIGTGGGILFFLIVIVLATARYAFTRLLALGRSSR